MKVKAELDESARKKAKADEKKIKKIKENLGRTGAQAKQAKSHQKAMQKRMEKDGGSMDVNADMYRPDRPIEIRFLECGGGLPSPFLKFNDVSYVFY
jgi:ATP-binding cassette subfamily F protein 2